MRGSNSKKKMRNSKQYKMTEAQIFQTIRVGRVLDFGILNFEIISDFDIRISDFS